MKAIPFIREVEVPNKRSTSESRSQRVHLENSEEGKEFLKQIHQEIKVAVILGPRSAGKSTLLNSLIGYQGFTESSLHESLPPTHPIEVLSHENWLLFDTAGSSTSESEESSANLLFPLYLLTATVLIILDTVENLCNGELLSIILRSAFQSTRGFGCFTKRKLIIAVKCSILSETNKNLLKERVNTCWSECFDKKSSHQLSEFYVVEVIPVPFDQENNTYTVKSVASLWTELQSFPATQSTAFILEAVHMLLPQLNENAKPNLPEVERQASLRSVGTILSTAILQEYCGIVRHLSRAKELTKNPQCWANHLRSRLVALRLPEAEIAEKLAELTQDFSQLRKEAEHVVVRSERDAFYRACSEKAKDPEQASSVLDARHDEEELASILRSWHIQEELISEATKEFIQSMDPVRAQAQTTLLKDSYTMKQHDLASAAELFNHLPDDWNSLFEQVLSPYTVESALKDKLYKDFELVLIVNKARAIELAEEHIIQTFIEEKLKTIAVSPLESYRVVTNSELWKDELRQRLIESGFNQTSAQTLLDIVVARGSQIEEQATDMLTAYCRADIEYHQFKLDVCQHYNARWFCCSSKNIVRNLKATLNKDLQLIDHRFRECINKIINKKRKLFVQQLGNNRPRGNTTQRSVAYLNILIIIILLCLTSGLEKEYSLKQQSSYRYSSYQELPKERNVLEVIISLLLICLVISVATCFCAQRTGFPTPESNLSEDLTGHFAGLTSEYNNFLLQPKRSHDLGLLLTVDQEVLGWYHEQFNSYDLEVLLQSIMKTREERKKSIKLTQEQI